MSSWSGSTASGLLSVVDKISPAFNEINNGHDIQSLFQSSHDNCSISISDSGDIGFNGELPFCVKDNINECAAYLSQELVSIGMPSLYGNSRNESFELTHLFNATYHLLQRFQRCVKSKDDLQDSKFRAESDLEHQHIEKARLLSQIEQLKRDLSQACLREKQLAKINKSVGNKLKLEKEESKRLQAVILSRDAQYKHSMKKKEMELVKLKDRLHTLLVDKTDVKIEPTLISSLEEEIQIPSYEADVLPAYKQSQVVAHKGIELSDVLTRQDGKRGHWKLRAPNVEEELYRTIMSSYEEKQKTLLVENHEMRQCLGNLQQELHKLLHAESESFADSTSDCISLQESQLNESVVKFDHLNPRCYDDPDASVSVNTGHFMMPFSLVQEDLVSDIQQKLSSLNLYIRAFEESGSDEKRDFSKQLVIEKQAVEIERLHRRLERYRSLIEQNCAQLDESSHQTRETSHQHLDDVDSNSERDMLMQEKRLFYEQLVEFEEKKRALAEAEFHLNKERIALQIAKCHVTPVSNNGNSPYDIQRPQSAQPTSASSFPRATAKRALPSTPSMSSQSSSGVLPNTPSMSSQSSSRSCNSTDRRAASSQIVRKSTSGMATDVYKSPSLGKVPQSANGRDIVNNTAALRVSKQLSDTVLNASVVLDVSLARKEQQLKSSGNTHRHC